jgi:phenylalanyl-tRNA synthetase beta chain
MQISEAWLREYVNPPLSTEQLVAQLTMAGLEVDSVKPAAAVFSGVVIGEVVSVEQHPDADRLRVCHVNVGRQEPLQIVCGASNVRPGLKVPAALVGAVLPGEFKIKLSKLRGIESSGMLCSEQEIGLKDAADGLMELPDNAPVGADIRDYLDLNDNLVEVDLTPNRADCLSVEGVAREIALLNNMDWSPIQANEMTVQNQDTLSVTVAEPAACPRYLGRLIKNVDVKAETPVWMKERLRRSGIRSLGPIVDVTNYVLIEMGQPLHAFDANKLIGGIVVRMAEKGEKLALLNGQEINFDTGTLIIADQSTPLALAGVMGGTASAVGDATKDIFLECAFFAPRSVAGKARKYGLHTDSSHRFERGVDPHLQVRAMSRACQLILDIAGGQPGPITEVSDLAYLPVRVPVNLRKQRIEKMLGVSIADGQVQAILNRLGMIVDSHSEGWLVTPPGFRFDIAIEADLIEEIARVYGYNNLPTQDLTIRARPGHVSETVLKINRVKDLLVDRGYQEAITYSFVDEDIQKTLAPDDTVIRLQNPISSEMSVMRGTLWCGLVKAAQYNLNRQQNRVRLFETGLRFRKQNTSTEQQKMIAGLALGNTVTEQWGEITRVVDFFDVKADLEAIIALTGRTLRFQNDTHPALHPGQTAKIISEHDETIGVVGMLHPLIEKKLGFETSVFLFELNQDLLLDKKLSTFKPLSKYPSVKRDIALIVRENIAADDVKSCIKDALDQSVLQEINLFDIYRGKGIDQGHKSMAVSITLQNFAQTLTDSEIDATFNKIIQTLSDKLGGKLRE